LLVPALAWSQAPSVPVPVPGAAKTVTAPGGNAAKQSPPRLAATSNATAFSELTPAQRRALAPLGGTWHTLSAAQQRKWIALSRNFGTMSLAEQSTIHGRMSEWAALSPRDRAQARLNFGEVQQLPAEDRKAKWEAYQALSPEEKRKLAADAKPKIPAAAAAVRPVPADKLTAVPRAPRDTRIPRIDLSPEHAASGGATTPPQATPEQPN